MRFTGKLATAEQREQFENVLDPGAGGRQR